MNDVAEHNHVVKGVASDCSEVELASFDNYGAATQWAKAYAQGTSEESCGYEYLAIYSLGQIDCTYQVGNGAREVY